MKVRFTPQMYMEYYAKRRGITVKEIGVAQVAILSWAPSVIKRLAGTVNAEPNKLWPWQERHLFLTGQINDLSVSFAQVGIGAPATITAMEEMIACGVKAFIGLGWAGSLQPIAPVGSLLIPGRCVREEGTSRHYLPDNENVLPNPKLASLLLQTAQKMNMKLFQKPHWTTDAPYREFTDTITMYGKQGIFGVDMETSAMYALGQFREVAVCNLLVVSDELWSEWHPIFRTPVLKEATLHAEALVLKFLEETPDLISRLVY